MHFVIENLKNIFKIHFSLPSLNFDRIFEIFGIIILKLRFADSVSKRHGTRNSFPISIVGRFSGQPENRTAMHESRIPQRNLDFFVRTIFPAAYLAGHIFCPWPFVSYRVWKWKPVILYRFVPLPVFGHRIRSSWRGCFRGSIDFYRTAASDFLPRSTAPESRLDRSIGR